MPAEEHTPQAARRLREFGRRRVSDEAGNDPVEAPAVAVPLSATLRPGSLWGPEATPTTADADEPQIHDPSGASGWRRRRGAPVEQPDSVHIDDEQGHDWWAKRDDLDTVVNPKKRGAAARAQRAAREAFAPAGTTNVSSKIPGGGPATSDSSTWNPADVYSWNATPPSDPAPQPPAPEPRGEPTPWDVLGLTSEATWAEVRRQHKQLAKRHHPDRHGSDNTGERRQAEMIMAEINAAFSDLRRVYLLTDGA